MTSMGRILGPRGSEGRKRWRKRDEHENDGEENRNVNDKTLVERRHRAVGVETMVKLRLARSSSVTLSRGAKGPPERDQRGL